MTKTYKERRKEAKKKLGRLDIPWHRVTQLSVEHKFYGIDSFFNAMVNEYKIKVEEELPKPLPGSRLNFLVLYRINMQQMAEIQTIQFMPQTKEQDLAALEQVMMGIISAYAMQYRWTKDYKSAQIHVGFDVKRQMSILVVKASNYDGEARIKIFEIIRNAQGSVVDFKETHELANEIPHQYLDKELQYKVDSNKREWSKP